MDQQRSVGLRGSVPIGIDVPVMPPAELENFVNFFLNETNDVLGCYFGQADLLHNYVIATPEWETPYETSPYGGPWDSPPDTPTPTLTVGLDWSTSTTGNTDYEDADISDPVDNAPFMAILCKESGNLFPIASGYMQVGHIEEISPLGPDVTWHYDGDHTLSFDIASTTIHDAFRPIILNPGGTFGGDGAPDHVGTGSPLTINWVLPFSPIVGAPFWVGLVHKSDDLAHAFADMNGFFEFQGCILLGGTSYDGPAITRYFDAL